jgi:type I restriction enzyme S subunit
MSDGWKKQHFGQLFEIKHGYPFKSEHFSIAGPFILLTPGNFYEEGGFKLKGQEKYYVGDFPSEYILQHDDLLIAMTEQAEGLLGSSILIPEGNKYLHNQRLGLVTHLSEAEIDRFFLYHLFNVHYSW